MIDSASATLDPEVARLAARQHLLRWLALCASDPAAERFGRAQDAALLELACAAARHLAGDAGVRPVELAPGEARPEDLDVAPLAAAVRETRGRLLEDHTRVFGLVVSQACPPYEVQYCPQTFSIFRSQRLADVAGFYRAFGVEPDRGAPERVDHVACELGFLAWLLAKERYARSVQGPGWLERAAICRDAQRDFLREHVAWWVPAYARALRTRALSLDPPAPLAAALGDVLAAVVPLERAALGVAPPTELAEPRPAADEDAGACGGCLHSGS